MMHGCSPGEYLSSAASVHHTNPFTLKLSLRIIALLEKIYLLNLWTKLYIEKKVDFGQIHPEAYFSFCRSPYLTL